MMRTISYPVIISPRPDRGYSVLFPDLPGCLSAGDSIPEAFEQAGEALDMHLSGMVEGGEALPPPSSMEKARELAISEYETDPADIAAVLLVAATPPGRVQRINISMDENLIAQIDALSSNRSAFLTDAARAELHRRRHA